MKPIGRDQLCAQLVEVILNRAATHPLRVAVDGPDCAGKSTLADELTAHLTPSRPVIRVSADDFHQPAAVRKQRGDLSADGYYYDAFDLQAIVDQVLRPLGPHGSLQYRPTVYDYRSDEPTQTMPQSASSKAVLLFDGVFLLRRELRPHWDLTLYLHVDPYESLRRALGRDRELFGSAENINRRYTQRYLPAQTLYRRHAGPESACDILIDMNKPTTPAIVRTAPR